MIEIVLQIISQFGMPGIILCMLGYLAWDKYKTNKEQKEKGYKDFREVIHDINDRIQEMERKSDAADTEIYDRMDRLEQRIEDINVTNHPTPEMEQAHINYSVETYPVIHTLLEHAKQSIDCDHIALAHFHNGTKGVTGIPFVKFTVVAEKYNPIEFPADDSLTERYVNMNMMAFDKMPQAMIQNDSVVFNIDDEKFQQIDSKTYYNCLKKGIKRIAMKKFCDEEGRPIGFIICYRFREGVMNKTALDGCIQLLEGVYQDRKEIY